MITTAARSAPAVPNIIFILADDIGYGDLSCYGATKVRTPNTDRIAREGMRFTDAHAGASVCSPTRYGFMTGQYAFRNPLGDHILSGEAPLSIKPDMATVASVLKPAGYATGIVGKKSVEVGTRVSPGQELLAVVPVDDIWVTANFNETQLRRMREGQRVTLKVDAFEHKYEGYIQSLAAASGARYSLLPPENATGNYVKVVQRIPVRIRLKDGENSDHRLRPGMSVEPKVWLN